MQFHRWFDEAKGEMAERDAVSLATATPDGRPSARMVLLRHVDDHSFGWYTNYESRKGRELAGESLRRAPLVLRAAAADRFASRAPVERR